MDDMGPEGAPADVLSTINRFWSDVVGKRNLDLLPDVVAADYRLHFPLTSPETPLVGPEQLRAFLERIFSEFPDAGASIQEQFALGENAVLTSLVLTPEPHAVEGAGEPGLAAPVGSYRCVTISRVADGKLVESWQFWEAARAQIELEPDTQGWSWRWPPWQWP